MRHHVRLVLGALAMGLCVASTVWADGPRLASPVVAKGKAKGSVQPVALDAAGYAALGREQAAVLTGFPLGPGRTADLDVERFEVLTADAAVVIGTAAGDIPAARPDVVLLRGTIAGRPETKVYLALSPHGCNGTIEADDSLYILSSDRAGGQPCVYDMHALPDNAIKWKQNLCGGGIAIPGDNAGPNGGEGGGLRGVGFRTVTVALEGDYEYTSGVFGGNTAAAEAYMVSVLGGVSEIYRREFNTNLMTPFVRVWADAADPYDSTFPVGGPLLSQFGGYWNTSMTGVQRNLAHLFTGNRPSGAGGIAYLSVLCPRGLSYGVSGYINGSFPNPLVNNSTQTWDLVVVAHEIGHNFGAIHTHEMAPVVDGCGNGDCSQAARGTIMSYCHTCSGGMRNIALNMHQRVISEYVWPYLVSTGGCVVSGTSGPRTMNVTATTDCTNLTGSVNATLLPGSYAFLPVSPDSGGAYWAWSPAASNSGCSSGCCTTGWQWSYQYVIGGTPTNVGLSGCNRDTNTGAFTSLAQPAYLTVATNTFVQFRVNDTASCTNNRGGVSLRIVRCPQITGQPAASASLCTGSPALTLSVTATGDDLAFRWHRDGQPLSDDARISGSASASLAISTLAVTDSGSYTCVVSNGCSSVTSSSSAVTVGAAPAQSSPQPGAVVLTAGQNAAFNVPASPGSATYQWRRNGSALSNGPRISGATTPSLSITGTVESDTGAYDVVVGNSCGSSTSPVASLDVYCPADFDRDHAVNPADLASFVNAWLADLTSGQLTSDADGNGAIDPADIAAFVNLWLQTVTNGC